MLILKKTLFFFFVGFCFYGYAGKSSSAHQDDFFSFSQNALKNGLGLCEDHFIKKSIHIENIKEAIDFLEKRKVLSRKSMDMDGVRAFFDDLWSGDMKGLMPKELAQCKKYEDIECCLKEEYQKNLHLLITSYSTFNLLQSRLNILASQYQAKLLEVLVQKS